ncbi:hypothetical protein DFH07DRAFT_973850 [Mycena maculata]|uniref:SET domain-containing protein n=1 Tax=Mycena maculata TaxID=230809 RepID=A0AAD7MGN6_9AGAR|nr:hypothetical protein DFH07DRAFT_973850 [Mycena maculata]
MLPLVHMSGCNQFEIHAETLLVELAEVLSSDVPAAGTHSKLSEMFAHSKWILTRPVRLMNHHCDANCVVSDSWVIISELLDDASPSAITVYTNRDIKLDEELPVKYGDNFSGRLVKSGVGLLRLGLGVSVAHRQSKWPPKKIITTAFAAKFECHLAVALPARLEFLWYGVWVFLCESLLSCHLVSGTRNITNIVVPQFGLCGIPDLRGKIPDIVVTIVIVDKSTGLTEEIIELIIENKKKVEDPAYLPEIFPCVFSQIAAQIRNAFRKHPVISVLCRTGNSREGFHAMKVY